MVVKIMTSLFHIRTDTQMIAQLHRIYQVDVRSETSGKIYKASLFDNDVLFVSMIIA